MLNKETKFVRILSFILANDTKSREENIEDFISLPVYKKVLMVSALSSLLIGGIITIITLSISKSIGETIANYYCVFSMSVLFTIMLAMVLEFRNDK